MKSNADVVREACRVIWSEGELSRIGDFYAEDFQADYPVTNWGEGLAGIAALAGGIRAAFPDYHERIDELIDAGDRIVVRLTITGTHRGPLPGLEAAGREVRYVQIPNDAFTAGLTAAGMHAEQVELLDEVTLEVERGEHCRDELVRRPAPRREEGRRREGRDVALGPTGAVGSRRDARLAEERSGERGAILRGERDEPQTAAREQPLEVAVARPGGDDRRVASAGRLEVREVHERVREVRDAEAERRDEPGRALEHPRSGEAQRHARAGQLARVAGARARARGCGAC